MSDLDAYEPGRPVQILRSGLGAVDLSPIPPHLRADAVRMLREDGMFGAPNNAIPERLREAPMIDVLSWADCYIRHTPIGWIAVDARTGESISEAIVDSDRLRETWDWLRSAHGRFDGVHHG